MTNHQRLFPLLVIAVVCSPWSIASGDDFKFTVANRPTAAMTTMEIQPGLPEGFDQELLTALVKDELPTDPDFAWFTYGDGHSRSVAVMSVGQPPSHLWVDLNRDKQFQRDEMVSAVEGAVWQTPLDAEFVVSPTEYRHQGQSILLRWSSKSKRFSLITNGVMLGRIDHPTEVASQCAASYIDANNNGSWFDPLDRFFVDLNLDGRLDPILERFACQSSCRIGTRQFVMAGDESGRRMKLLELTEMGSVLPGVSLSGTDTKILSVQATLASDNGICVNIDSVAQPVSCPVGTYRVAKLRLTTQSPAGQHTFNFDKLGQDGARCEVSEGSTAEFQLLGEMTLTAIKAILRSDDSTRLSITPTLTTETGLYLTSSRRGERTAHIENRLTMRSFFAGEPFHIGSSGFS